MHNRNFSMYFKLVDRKVVPCTLEEWCAVMEGQRHVALTPIGGWWVSTVFLGLDHGFSSRDDAAPVVFETMMYSDEKHETQWFDGGKHEYSDWADYQTRCCTWEEAELMHQAAYDQVCAWLNQASLVTLDLAELLDPRR